LGPKETKIMHKSEEHMKMAGNTENSTKEFVHDQHPGRELSLIFPETKDQVNLFLQESFTLKALFP
jgi:hypothetical protein